MILCWTSAFGVLDFYSCSNKIVPGGSYPTSGKLYFPPEVSVIYVTTGTYSNNYYRAYATYDSELNMYYVSYWAMEGNGNGKIQVEANGVWLPNYITGFSWVAGSCSGGPEPPVNYYSLGVAVPTDGGSIVNVNEGEAVTYEVWEYEDGTDVDLSVIPNLGWSFHSWLIDGSATSTSDTLRVTMDDNHVVEARFTDNLDPVDPDNPDDDIKRSEWWGTYEKTYDDVKWKEWTLNDTKIADFITSGEETGVYYDDDLVGYMIDNESVHILMPLIDERYWIYGNGQAIGYIDEDDYICLGNRTFSHIAGHINVDGSATFLGQAAEVSFGSKIYGVIRFYDEYGEVVLNIRDRFWEGYWIPDDPMYDPEDPGTYPDEPEWKDIPEEPEQPGIFDEIFEDIKRFIVGFLREYFMPDQDLLEFHANELKRKASDKFPFSLFWIPEKLQGEYEDVDIPLLDLSMFGVDDFKVDWFNNEYMDQAAEWMKNFSRYLLWFMFILWLRDNITPVLVID